MTDGNIRVEGDAGKTDIHSFGGKAYLTWFKEDAYVDTVLTFNRHKQKMRANLMEGTTAHAAYHNFGFGISSEGGIRFNFWRMQMVRRGLSSLRRNSPTIDCLEKTFLFRMV